MNSSKKIFCATLSFLCLGLLSGCKQAPTPPIQATPVMPEPQVQEQTTLPTDQTTTLSPETIQESVVAPSQKLSVNAGCIGCGKCARIASAVFSMQGHHARVISQEHNTESQVQQAIDNCPVQAISLS